MRKMRILQGLLVGGLLFAGSAMAEMKIGILDLGKVVDNSPQATEIRESLQREAQKRERDLRAKVEQLQKLEEKFKRDSAVMSDSEVRRLERDILSRQRKLSSEKKDHEAEMSLRLNEEREKLYKHISEVVRKIGKQDGYDVILTPQSVAYFDPKLDISDKVLSQLKTSR